MPGSPETESGLPALGALRWGSHFCHFYRSDRDLADTLVPYLRAGLDRGERCLWVTSAPLPADAARAALREAVPDLAAREARGQIEIVDHAACYRQAGTRGGGPAEADAVLQDWVDRERAALAGGWSGLRLTGNTAWLERSGWRSFMEYEARVTGTFRPRRIVGLCSYSLERCGAEEVLDVVRHHEFALVRRDGAWEVLESDAVRQAKAELARANAALEERVAERTAELQAALQARDAFLSVASHELRTPMTALQLGLDHIVRAAHRGALPTDELLRKLRRAQLQGERLASLVRDLLDLSRARTGTFEISPRPMDLAALAREVVERLAEPLARTGNAVAVSAPESLEGSWDRVRLEQVLTNLVVNAGRHAPGAPVEVEVGEAIGGAWLVVRDRGPGIAREDQPRIFDAFTQLDPAHAPGGFGLGLWIVRRIVEAHGGEVRIESAPGRGAAFVVSLPAAPLAGAAHLH